jgi:hypothetical protein
MIAAMLLAGGQSQTFTGVITDDMCKRNHAMMDIKPDAKCIVACVKGHGSKYALRDGEKIYKLSDQQTPEQYAGQKVKITGVLYEKTAILKVESITPVK